jgi:hypothetical protein
MKQIKHIQQRVDGADQLYKEITENWQDKVRMRKVCDGEIVVEALGYYNDWYTLFYFEEGDTDDFITEAEKFLYINELR